jgi:hypothetical protein
MVVMGEGFLLGYDNKTRRRKGLNVDVTATRYMEKEMGNYSIRFAGGSYWLLVELQIQRCTYEIMKCNILTSSLNFCGI